MEHVRYPEHLVFGLDIGTRSIVGTVGYKENTGNFVVVAQCVKMHDTRAMVDGQIHDIIKVSDTIASVKKELEQQIGKTLTDVSIAAAGRVLKTVSVRVDHEFNSETIINEEHIYSLDLLGVEKAYETLREELKEEKINFYCVGYSVIRYYLNGYSILKLEGHKGSKVSAEILATFLPDEVIDGLYAAVERANLYVTNLTLEPIAAINVAIPEKFRLLNIALVDVGAGTSDLSITKDGSIVAYGMIPFAGDEITEAIVQKYLVEFNVAETMKVSAIKKKKITYKDIMGISNKIDSSEIINTVSETIEKITGAIASKILELNGGKSVSAVFIVGGGGKVPGFVTSLAKALELPTERVALRGEEVLGDVTFLQGNIKKDPLLVTPIGICLNYYDKTNNFIYVTINKERVKLYDNNKLTIVDAAIQLGFPNEKLFPQRGKAIHYTLNGTKRMVKGELGEAAIVKLNGEVVGLNSKIKKNDIIEIIESTMGADALFEVRQLSEYNGTITFIFNGQTIICPKFVMANNQLVSEFYNIKENDEIRILNYYTLKQVLEFMDLSTEETYYVNHIAATLEEKVYENFTIECNLNKEEPLNSCYEPVEGEVTELENNRDKDIKEKDLYLSNDVYVIINNEPVKLTGKKDYIFVDIFDFYPFDLTKAQGFEFVTTLNGEKADFTMPLKEKDVIELYWKE